jgi:N-acetylneuraminic acid mutarotase
MRWNSRVLCSFWDANNNAQQLLQRYHHTCVIYENKYMFLYGGLVNEHSSSATSVTTTNSFIKYNLETGEYSTLNRTIHSDVILPSLSHHTMTLINDRIFIFGGKNETQTVSDIYAFDLVHDLWTKIKCSGTVTKGKSTINNHAPKRYGYVVYKCLLTF